MTVLLGWGGLAVRLELAELPEGELRTAARHIDGRVDDASDDDTADEDADGGQLRAFDGLFHLVSSI